MSLTASILIILSAITHVGWNLVSKKIQPTIAFYLVANIVGVFCVSPVFIYYWSEMNQVLNIIWVQVLFSGLFLSGYIAALAFAYSAGDLSIAYPLTRSLPIIFVTLITMIFSLGQSLSWWFILGALFIFFGCFMLPMKIFRNFKSATFEGSLYLIGSI